MPLNAMRRVDPLLDRIMKPLKPSKIIQEIAKSDRPSFYRNFKGYRIEKFGRPQLVAIARKEMQERQNELWAQLLIVLWNETQKDLYIAFRDRVATLSDDVEKVLRISDELGAKWIDELVEKWALEDILICVHMNEVRFSDAFIRSRLEAPLGITRDAGDLAHGGAAEDVEIDPTLGAAIDKSAAKAA